MKNQAHRLRVIPQTPEATALVKAYAMKLPPQTALIERGLFAGWFFVVTGPSSETIIKGWIENSEMGNPVEVIGAGARNQNASPPTSWLHDDTIHQTHLNELLNP